LLAAAERAVHDIMLAVEALHDDLLAVWIDDPVFGYLGLCVIGQLFFVIALVVFGIVAYDLHHQVRAVPDSVVPGVEVILVQEDDVGQANFARSNAESYAVEIDFP
jgi:hypothetical protein